MEGTTLQFNQAALVDVSTGNKDGINLEILKAIIISGAITLPEGHIAQEEGIQVTIWVLFGTSKEPVVGTLYPTGISIPAGQNQADYSLVVPPSNSSGNGSNQKYWVFYSIAPGYYDYFPEGWYSADIRILCDNTNIQQQFFKYRH